jgi:hypothetical protein
MPIQKAKASSKTAAVKASTSKKSVKAKASSEKKVDLTFCGCCEENQVPTYSTKKPTPQHKFKDCISCKSRNCQACWSYKWKNCVRCNAKAIICKKCYDDQFQTERKRRDIEGWKKCARCSEVNCPSCASTWKKSPVAGCVVMDIGFICTRCG